ncbi:MAG: D-alanyl-D-alanine carboxypeptidase [Azospirillum sp.]|nr:D-alanyl-D-alanine carboxypeptidase [Azospirillum sp.]
MTMVCQRLAAVITAAVWFAATLPVAQAGTIDTSARQAYLIDLTTHTVLLDKNGDQRMPTSSMSKIMTMYMVFDALKGGRLSLDDTLPVSERAWRMQGSKMFVEINNRIKVEDLIRGVVIQSGNDAAIVFAEALGGTEENFAHLMTKKAKEIGLLNSNFMNATGWPHPDHYSTCHDLAILAERLMYDFPEYYHYDSERDFTYHGIKQGNRNPLLYRNMGVDGLKTGHTETAGYGLTASAIRDGRRLVLVANGMPSMQARADESARLIEWGFREFGVYELFQPGETVEQAQVWLGDAPTVPLVVEGGLKLTMTPGERKDMKVVLKLDEPVAAPIAKGARLGTLVISGPGFVTREVPAVAAADVGKQNLLSRAMTVAGHLLFGWI